MTEPEERCPICGGALRRYEVHVQEWHVECQELGCSFDLHGKDWAAWQQKMTFQGKLKTTPDQLRDEQRRLPPKEERTAAQTLYARILHDAAQVHRYEARRALEKEPITP